MTQLESPTVLDMLRKIEKRGALTMAKKVKGHCSQIFRYAIATSRCTRDPCSDLRGALKPSPPAKHHKAVSQKELPELLRRIDRYAEDFREAFQLTQIALQLVTITLLRTTELRAGEWEELEALDTDSPLRRVPDERMKMKDRGHLVPLPRQAVALLHQLRTITGKNVPER